MARTTYFISTVLAACISCDRCVSAESADGPRELADFIVTGIRDSRERLRQGAVEGSGKHSVVQADGQKRDFEFTFFYAFDWDKHIFRAEREEPRVTRKGEVFTSRDIYFREPGRSVQYNPRWGHIQILPEDFGMRRSLHAFDVRAVGLLYRETYDRATRFDEILDAFATQAPGEAFDEGGGIYRVRWVLDDVVRRTILVNRREGFSVTRFEVADRRVPPMPIEDDGWPMPFLTNDATWTQINGVWVPKTFRIDDRSGPDDSKPQWRYTHDFDWTSVNEPLPIGVTDIDKLGAEKGTLVVNRKGKASVVERVIGIEDTRLEGELRKKREPRAEPKVSASKWQVLFLIGNAIVLLVVATIVAARVWKRRHVSGAGPN